MRISTILPHKDFINSLIPFPVCSAHGTNAPPWKILDYSASIAGSVRFSPAVLLQSTVRQKILGNDSTIYKKINKMCWHLGKEKRTRNLPKDLHVSKIGVLRQPVLLKIYHKNTHLCNMKHRERRESFYSIDFIMKLGWEFLYTNHIRIHMAILIFTKEKDGGFPRPVSLPLFCQKIINFVY